MVQRFLNSLYVNLCPLNFDTFSKEETDTSVLSTRAKVKRKKKKFCIAGKWYHACTACTFVVRATKLLWALQMVVETIKVVQIKGAATDKWTAWKEAVPGPFRCDTFHLEILKIWLLRPIDNKRLNILIKFVVLQCTENIRALILHNSSLTVSF